MVTVFVPFQLWIASDIEGCNGPGSCRDFTIGVQGGQIASVVMHEPYWDDQVAYSMPQLRAMVGVQAWPSTIAKILAEAEKQAELPPDWRNVG